MSGGDFKDLFGAAVRGDEELVRFHLARGVDPDHVHPELQSTALVTCILAGQEGTARLLLAAGADPTLWSALDETTPVGAARRAGLEALVQHLVALGAPDPGPPMVEWSPASSRRWPWRRRGVSGSSRAPGASR
jgi:ankyrin repeat protein